MEPLNATSYATDSRPYVSAIRIRHRRRAATIILLRVGDNRQMYVSTQTLHIYETTQLTVIGLEVHLRDHWIVLVPVELDGNLE